MKEIKYLNSEERKKLDSYALKIIDYRRTGISLNHIIGCPLDCAYCVRHFWGNFVMKEPHLLCTDEEAVRLLLENKFFVKDSIPIQFFHICYRFYSTVVYTRICKKNYYSNVTKTF